MYSRIRLEARPMERCMMWKSWLFGLRGLAMMIAIGFPCAACGTDGGGGGGGGGGAGGSLGSAHQHCGQGVACVSGAKCSLDFIESGWKCACNAGAFSCDAYAAGG